VAPVPRSGCLLTKKHTNKNNGNFLSEKLVVFTDVCANLSSDLSTDLADTMDATGRKDDAAAPVPGAKTFGRKRKAQPPADSCGAADSGGAPRKTARPSKPQEDAARAEKELAASRRAMQEAVNALDQSPDDPLLKEQATAARWKYEQKLAFYEHCRAGVQLDDMREQRKLPGADAVALGAKRLELMAFRKQCMRRVCQFAKPPLVVRSEATAAPCAQPAAPCAQPAAPCAQPAAPCAQPAAPCTQQAAPANQRTVSAQALGAFPVRTVEGAGFTMRVFDPKGANAFLKQHLGFGM
jgi:predicted component of type VI protein secretion system